MLTSPVLLDGGKDFFLSTTGRRSVYSCDGRRLEIDSPVQSQLRISEQWISKGSDIGQDTPELAAKTGLAVAREDMEDRIQQCQVMVDDLKGLKSLTPRSRQRKALLFKHMQKARKWLERFPDQVDDLSKFRITRRHPEIQHFRFYPPAAIGETVFVFNHHNHRQDCFLAIQRWQVIKHDYGYDVDGSVAFVTTRMLLRGPEGEERMVSLKAEYAHAVGERNIELGFPVSGGSAFFTLDEARAARVEYIEGLRQRMDAALAADADD